VRQVAELAAQKTRLEATGPAGAIQLGQVCIWTRDFPDLVQHHDAMEADVDRLLNSGERNLRASGEQTTSTLQTMPGQHWSAFFEAVRRAITSVIDDSPGKIDEGTVHIRAWATRLRPETIGSRDLHLAVLHNHSPAFLSGVYYVRIPEKRRSDNIEGTYFVNPFPHSLASPNPGVLVAAALGRLVLFPSWVLHSASLADVHQWRSSRLVVAIDAHITPR
jgi:Putative 2OG-Fe(II) oxygenase